MNKNYTSYILIVLLIGLFIYIIHLEDKIADLKSDLSEKNEIIAEMKNNPENPSYNNIEDTLSDIKNTVDNIDSDVSEIYAKTFPDENQELVVLKDD